MKTSVAIPTFNSSRTIRTTLESALRQTSPPDEILVVDDGSTDDTLSIVSSYGPPVKVFQQEHGGAARARNELCAQATGDLIAFLDSDDLWHPDYLKAQKRAFQENPSAALFFTGHVDIRGYEEFRWEEDLPTKPFAFELFTPTQFLRRYYRGMGSFVSMSHCSARTKAIRDLGNEPFQVHGAEDLFFYTQLPLFGWSVALNPTPLVAYRITSNSLSANSVVTIGRSIEALEMLAPLYHSKSDDPMLRREFGKSFAHQKRVYAKLLMGAGRASDARHALTSALGLSRDPEPLFKSLGLLFETYLPTALQPTWPRIARTPTVPGDSSTDVEACHSPSLTVPEESISVAPLRRQG